MDKETQKMQLDDEEARQKAMDRIQEQIQDIDTLREAYKLHNSGNREEAKKLIDTLDHYLDEDE